LNKRFIAEIKQVALMFLVVWGMFVTQALAADGFEFTRQHYDLIMRWFNFIILFAVIYKFGRKPIIAFLTNQKNDVSRSIEKLEIKKQEALNKIKERKEELAHSQERLVLINERIESEGQQVKEQIIRQAQEESRILIETASHKIHGQIREAYNALRAELIDAAADMALSKLPSMIVQNDHDRLINQWLNAAES
jgi:F-type H+-transporting ATPase subunit b